MRRLILSFSVFLLLSTASFSQIRVAIAGGGHQASVNETNSLPRWDSIKNNYTGRGGAHFGVVADIPFSIKSKLYFQPGVMLYNKGRKYTGTFDTIQTRVSENKKQFINYIDIPLNLIYKFGTKTKFVIGGGPYGSFFYNGKEKTETQLRPTGFQQYENSDLPVGKKPGNYKIFDYGVNALAGAEFGKVFLTANYTRGLGDFYTANYDGSFKHQTIGATLGIFLGKPLKMEPAVKDKDKDGIPDDKDNCPTEAGPALTNGCPDKDGDGIANKDDKCPDAAGPVSRNGCPVTDKDNDGIDDINDKCPDVAGSKLYNGCPIPDSDGDGINDEDDKCKDVAGYGRYEGCPAPDTDGDGVTDDNDKCPAAAGSIEDGGCPAVKKEIIEKVNYSARRIQFQFSKADLLPASNRVLDEIVKILKDNPELKLSIEGHTSNVNGTKEQNLLLSIKRAETVKKYLIAKGIDATRLSAAGFGSERPLNEGKTEAEKALNRRVELIPSYNNSNRPF
jgi:OmpA-OmpF porin, OOP family